MPLLRRYVGRLRLSRIWITGRDEVVKEAVTKIDIPVIKILRDRLYPVKVDNSKRTGMIDDDGAILPRAVAALETDGHGELVIRKKYPSAFFGTSLAI